MENEMIIKIGKNKYGDIVVLDFSDYKNEFYDGYSDEPEYDDYDRLIFETESKFLNWIKERM